MQPKKIFFIITILFFSSFISATHIQETQSKCGLIKTEDINIKLPQGTKTSITTIISNYSREKFFVDFLYLEEHGNITSSIIKQPKTINPVGYAPLKLNISAPETGEKFSEIIINLRGHFEDNTICMSNQLQKTKINIEATENPHLLLKQQNNFSFLNRQEKTACNLFNLVVPKTATALNGRGKTSFFVANQSGKTANIILIGSNVVPETGVFSIPTSIQKELELEYTLTGNNGSISFAVQIPECIFEAKETQITELNPTPSNQATKIKTKEKISVKEDITLEGNKYNAKITIKNNEQKTVTPVIWFELPENWLVKGEQQKSIPANSEKEFLFTIIPENPVTSDTLIIVNVSSEKTIASKKIQLPATQQKSTVQPTGLSLLALQKSSTIILTVLTIILILLLVSYALTRKTDYSRYRVWSKNKENKNRA